MTFARRSNATHFVNVITSRSGVLPDRPRDIVIGGSSTMKRHHRRAKTMLTTFAVFVVLVGHRVQERTLRLPPRLSPKTPSVPRFSRR
jgi:hypothetical protein